MDAITVAAAALNQTPLDWPGNLTRIRAAMASAREARAQVLCLPEMNVPGYGCEDVFLAPHLADRAWQAVEELATESENLILTLGIPLWLRGAVYNAIALIANGRILGITPKQHLAGDGLHYEPRWFKPWPPGVVTTWNGVPVGDLLYEIGGVRFGIEICEDAWVASTPGSRLAARGADVILHPSASHFAFGKDAIRHRYVLEHSRAYGSVYLYANLLGNEAGRAIYDGGTLIACGGRLLAAHPRLSFREHHLIHAAIPLDRLRSEQARTVGRAVAPDDGADVAIDFPWKDEPAVSIDPSTTYPTLSKEEEFAHAVALALFDYLRKSHSRGFVLSLSGGADSGAIACLVRIMLDLSRAELGDVEVVRRLGDWLKLPEPGMAQLLTCVYQASENSSETTETAARTLAKSLGASFHRWEISGLIEKYTGLASSALDRELSWERDDLALQNIQARVRSPGIWMLANLRGALLLATSNRSEAAVGYTTMDGDTSGGLSPICGIDKAFLRHWLRWLETEGSDRIRPIPELTLINAQQPTAELRPESEAQTDEADLMPFPVLDAIERAAIRDKSSPATIVERLAVDFPDEPRPQRVEWVRRFFRLWSRNQWKRERFAPSFHLDDENLDPKTWCRFPILSGGFEQELNELDDA